MEKSMNLIDFNGFSKSLILGAFNIVIYSGFILLSVGDLSVELVDVYQKQVEVLTDDEIRTYKFYAWLAGEFLRYASITVMTWVSYKQVKSGKGKLKNIIDQWHEYFFKSKGKD